MRRAIWARILFGSAILIAAASARAAGVVCSIGRDDDFDTRDGIEPTTPSDSLVNAFASFRLAGCDACGADRTMAHTFANCGIDELVSARLVIHLMAVNGSRAQPENDLLLVGAGGTLLWGLRLDTLAGTPWTAGTTRTFDLDLDALPPSDDRPPHVPSYPSGVTSIVSTIVRRGMLDVVVTNDTCVDSIEIQGMRIIDAVEPVSWDDVKAIYR